jgi:hypothetical protein
VRATLAQLEAVLLDTPGILAVATGGMGGAVVGSVAKADREASDSTRALRPERAVTIAIGNSINPIRKA